MSGAGPEGEEHDTRMQRTQKRISHAPPTSILKCLRYIRREDLLTYIQMPLYSTEKNIQARWEAKKVFFWPPSGEWGGSVDAFDLSFPCAYGKWTL